MSPIRLLLVAAAVAVIGFLVLRKWSDDPSDTPPLTPDAVDASISSETASAAELATVSEAGPSGYDRRPADVPPTPAAPEPSTETKPAAPQVETEPSNAELQRALVTQIALLEAERDELRQSLGPLTKDAYQAAWDRNDFTEFASAPKVEDMEGKLVSVMRPNDGPYQMVTLPRAGFEDAYKVFDLSREKSDQIQKKKAELAAMRASARAN